MISIHHDPGCECNACRRRAARAAGLPSRPASLSPSPAPAAAPPRFRSLPCVHEGAVLEWCASCNGDRRHVRDCDLHERCTRGVVSDRVRACERCPDFDDGRSPAPARRVRIDPTDLATGAGGWRFNAGLVRYQDRLLLAYRTGWAGAQVHVAELDAGYRPGPSTTLDLFFPGRANYGREDPRLFVHNDRLHVGYIGVSGRNGPTHQMYAVLRDDLSVEKIHCPHLPGRQPWEKNWSMFSHGGELYAVYQCSPHTVVRLDGDRAEVVSAIDWSPKWSGGLLRGGAPPVRVGDTYWHWFHGRSDPGPVYSYGVVAFAAAPPFAPVAYTPAPLVAADPLAREGNYCAVVFPCGAVLDGDRWKVSLGVNDRRIEVHEWDHARVGKAMVPV